MPPCGAVRSSIPKRNSSGTSGTGTGGDQLYKCVLAWRPMAMLSSNPAVVTKATREPLRSRRILVPTVVPWRTSGAKHDDRHVWRLDAGWPGRHGVQLRDPHLDSGMASQPRPGGIAGNGHAT